MVAPDCHDLLDYVLSDYRLFNTQSKTYIALLGNIFSKGKTMNAKTGFKRVWMITGAARGIGARIVEAALAHGDAVVATSRDAASVQKRFPASGTLLALPLDVTDEGQAATAVQAALARFGRIDVLVNNAGYGLLGAVEEATADEVRRLYETNVFGLLHVTRAVLPAMRARRSGHVINISSLGGYQSAPGFGVYCSTKFAVEGLTEALHGELAPLGIHVTTVEPGYFRTDFLDSNSLAVSPRILDDYAASAGQVRVAATQINHNQPGDPLRLAQAMLKLVDAATPPLRLALGTDTLRTIADKHAFVEAELKAWRAVSASTDFPEEALVA
jgi:NAD(P)-dependent dehydrogenase (short-subunit alcohol dehydrogenase family)